MSDHSVETLFSDYDSLVEGPLAGDPSGLTALQLTYPKVLLLASASFLEHSLTGAVMRLYESNPESLQTMVRTKAFGREYSKLFDWKSGKATSFFALFGPEVTERFKAQLRNDDEFAATQAAFLEIGNLRNQLVHNNYASFVMNLSVNDIRDRHQSASKFPALAANILVPTDDPVQQLAEDTPSSA